MSTDPAFVSALSEAEKAARALLPGGAFTLQPVPGGANNRAWRVEAADGIFLLKQYYPPATEHDRDRFASERAFYHYAATRAPKAIPRALRWDETHRAGLFEYIEGRKLESIEVTDARVAEALGFFGVLNQPRPDADAVLPEAAEACFSVINHLLQVEKRMLRLLKIPQADGDMLVDDAGAFVVHQLLPAWRKVEAEVYRHAHAIDQSAPTRAVSPSDFGFHNALLESSDHLRFFDFEYAGWDDPAKTIGDFLCQPEIPAGLARRETVIAAIAAIFPGDIALPARARLLLPVYQIKWCGIMLNEFLPADHRRRAFALSAAATEARRARQLERARAALSALAP